MTTLIAIHSALSNTAWLFFLIIGLWGLFRAIRGQAVNGSYLGAAFIGQLIFVTQAVLGALMWIGGGSAAMQRPGIHLLYGIFALVFLPFIYLSVLRGDDTNRAQWVLAFTTLFLFGIALRSISTAI
ncbi:conserved membrane protein of unknown function [Candidatus Promineifilum breve]|uniref:Uncharacterized protein n=1 Tax=Candidatus Promineifilum breve TaxID=1806508 RepID=A0A160T6Z3_9CHLR|nr:hypothetical protein [Candidatus Promineifilum breve]CUS05359.2 conserved membrane protein of unknown function [Candidatus Promineifilum breve]